jgi:hypothetical protein
MNKIALPPHLQTLAQKIQENLGHSPEVQRMLGVCYKVDEIIHNSSWGNGTYKTYRVYKKVFGDYGSYFNVIGEYSSQDGAATCIKNHAANNKEFQQCQK